MRKKANSTLGNFGFKKQCINRKKKLNVIPRDHLKLLMKISFKVSFVNEKVYLGREKFK